MTSRRGLTLLEVLVATVLMAITTGACVPLIRESLAALRRSEKPHITVPELSRHVDQLLRGEAPVHLLVDGVSSMPWPDHPDRPPIKVSIASPPDDSLHTWATFQSGEALVVRWLPQLEAAIEDGTP
ncbi:MAG: prepilin-type N-terminal cleavage/methylation domain-containing protein [Acidimicrobiia bacterium]|nr:prepilin-type N-terminal cleavage/methylation domain-containing protein [Acidimicrobiia bacterium]